MASLEQAFNTLLSDKQKTMFITESEVPESGSYVSRTDSHTYLRDIPAQKPTMLKMYQNYNLSD